MAKKKIDTRHFIKKIEQITRERVTQEKVVSLSEFKELTKKQDPKTILVIDDDDSIRIAIKRIFETEGFKVLTAADGTQLSQVLDDSPIELIILDVGLPWINGFELAKLLKEHDDLKSIPLIFVSAKTSDEDVKMGFSLGADDYIKKPFDVPSIRKSVKTLINLSF